MGVIFEAERRTNCVPCRRYSVDKRCRQSTASFDPNVIIMNTGYAQILGFEDSIIMGTKILARMVVRKPEAKIIAVPHGYS